MANNSNTTIPLSIGESPARLSPVQYARPPARAARVSRWQAAILGALLLAVLLPAFISLGQWQWRKAELKTQLQNELEARSAELPVSLPGTLVEPETLHYRRVTVRGHYDAAHQILIDNRLHREQAGYHVVTPLRITGSNTQVMINRGWLPAPFDHRILPVAEVPAGEVELSGVVVIPGQRFFNLATQPTTGWAPVWQNLDMARLRQGLAPLQPFVIQLDPGAPGGYVREWPRLDIGAERHRSYALQWFGFACASLGIWIYFLGRRP